MKSQWGRSCRDHRNPAISHFRWWGKGAAPGRAAGLRAWGIDKRFGSFAPASGHRLAGRVSRRFHRRLRLGPVPFAYEGRFGSACPPGQWLRALCLSASGWPTTWATWVPWVTMPLAVGLASSCVWKGDWLRLSKALFGHLPPWTGDPRGLPSIWIQKPPTASPASAGHRSRVQSLRDIYDDHPGLQDRFITTGRVTPQLAAELGLTGLAGRASGIARDLRSDFPLPPCADLGFVQAGHRNGDVAAR